MFEELDPLGIPDLAPFEDMKSVRGLPRVFTELLWAAGAGEFALVLSRSIVLVPRTWSVSMLYVALCESWTVKPAISTCTLASASV